MAAYQSLLGHRNFLLLWLGGAISSVGDFFNSMALVKMMAEDPQHLGLLMSLVMLAKMVPMVLLAPVAGVVADRLPRRTVMLLSDLLRMVLVLGLVVVHQSGLMIALVCLAAAVSTFHDPASNALLPTLVTGQELVAAGSLQVATQRVAQVIGTGLGAVVLMHVGAHNVFYIDAASFLISALFTLALVLPSTSSQTSAAAMRRLFPSLVADVADGLRFIRNRAAIWHLTVNKALGALGDSSTNTLLAPFFIVGLGIAADRLGLIYALYGAACVLGALVIGGLGQRLHWRQMITLGSVYVWATSAGMVLGGHVWVSLLFFGLGGVGSGSTNVGLQTALGLLVPDGMRGRVTSTWNMLASLIYVLGAPLAGYLADRFGPGAVMLAYTSAYLVKGIYVHVMLRPRRAGVVLSK